MMNTNLNSNTGHTLRTNISIVTEGGHAILSGNPDPVLLKDMALPAEATYDFLNATEKEMVPGRSPVAVELFFGENQYGEDNISLGKFVLKGIHPAPGGPKQITVKVAVSASQVLSLALIDPMTQRERGLGFMDISNLEPPAVVPVPPEISNSNLYHAYYDQMLAIFDHPTPRKQGFSRRGEDFSQEVTLTLAEALLGVQKEIDIRAAETCHICQGSGAHPGTTIVRCPDCQGTGWIKDELETKEGPILRGVSCSTCQGEGLIIPHPCTACQGRTWIKVPHLVVVQIPAGVETGAEIRLLHQGAPGRNGGAAGHVMIHILVPPHPLFVRKGREVSIQMPVDVNFARAGGTLRVPGVELGSVHKLDLPSGSLNGEVFEVAQAEAYTLTAEIETYRSAFLFAMPTVRERLHAIKEALEYQSERLPASAAEAQAQLEKLPVLEDQVERIACSTGEKTQRYAEFYTKRGTIYAEKGNAARALADFNKALALDPRYASAYDQRCMIYLTQKEPAKALADINNALVLEPNNGEFYYHRGMLHHLQNELALALEDYQRALDHDAVEIDVLDSRSRLHTMQNNLEAALSDCDRALALEPDRADMIYRRGRVYQARNELGQALADYTRVVELEPKNDAALADRGQVKLLLNDLEGALEDMNQLVARHPKNARAYNNRGYLYLLLNQTDKAIEDYNQALALDGKLVTAYNNRGQVFLKLERYQQALEDFTQSLALHPGDFYVTLWLGQAYQGLGKKSMAASAYRKILSASDNLEIRQQAQSCLADMGLH